MKCQQCNLIFNNLTGVCPRCGAVSDGDIRYPLFSQPVFRTQSFSLSLLQLLLVITINASLLMFLINIILNNTILNATAPTSWWSLFAIIPLVVLYYTCSFIASNKNNILRKFRWFSRTLTFLMVMLQLLAFKGMPILFDYYFAVQFFILIISLVIIVAINKISLTRAYYSFISLAVMGMFPFIVTLCGVTTGSKVAFALNLSAMLVGIAFVFNIGLYCVLSIKSKASKIL